jgi:uncharacterized protein YlxW (UPF0749 family)
MERGKMNRKQLYLVGGIVGLLLVIFVAMMSYYIFKFRKDFLAEQAGRIAYQGQVEELLRRLSTTQAELDAKKARIEILENTIDEIQRRAGNLSEAKAKVEAEKMKLLGEIKTEGGIKKERKIP